jgi:beta-lactamase class A
VARVTRPRSRRRLGGRATAGPAVLLVFFFATIAHADFREFKSCPIDPSMDVAIKRAAEDTLKEVPKLTADNLAITLIDVTHDSTIQRADVRGDAPFYPASVVKIFYMAETFHQRKQIYDDVPRALKEMIRQSDNDATGFILDTISDTSSGPSLTGRALDKFIDKRRVVNQWLNPLGYDISAMAKPWSFGPFGRDVQLMGGPERPNRNRATSNAVASMLLWIVRHRAVSSEASDAMLALLKRPLPPEKDENQVAEFIGEALPAGSQLWSKAGWTSEVKHDAAYIELPSGRKLILVIFTRGMGDDKTIIPSIAKKVLANITPPAAQ